MKKLKSYLFALMFVIFSAVMFVGCNKDNTYSITIADIDNGFVSVSKDEAKSGEEIEITVTSQFGYELSSLTINGVKLNSLTFEMPAKDVKINAFFNKSTGDSNGVELIDYKLGSYVCQVNVNTEDGWCASADIYNVFRVKENNKADFYGFIYGQRLEIKDLLYTRDGNTITATFNEFEFVLQIFDENTILLKNNDYLSVFCYQEDKVLANGDYYMILNSDDRIDLTLKSNNNLDLTITTGEENEIYSGSYQIFGNRFIFKTINKLYVAKIEEIYETGFWVEDLAYFDLTEEYPSMNTIIEGMASFFEVA